MVFISYRGGEVGLGDGKYKYFASVHEPFSFRMNTNLKYSNSNSHANSCVIF